MPPALYKKHPQSLATTYADVENHALHQDEILIGTPGAISIRENAAKTRFYVRQYYDFDGKKRDQYLCQADTKDCEPTVEGWKKRIDEARQLQSSVRLLAREGYSTLRPKPLAALAALARHRIFEAGAVLVGTHAFEVIVNRLGIRVAVFATEDVDVARLDKLALDNPPKGGILELLRGSGIDFVAVPAFTHGAPASSFKERGRSRFTFDLLVPTSGDRIETSPVPELNAHATALPYLRYVLTETQTGAAMSAHGVVAVRVPIPERFALHKLIVAQLRAGRPERSRKDLRQAAVLIAALGELSPGAIEEAYRKTPASTRSRLRKSLEKVRPELEAHPQSWDEAARVAKLR
ncbi:MAG TPA: GSU2403 family nucleotidyltransferase fold protein [Usitatibacter sp.]|nr:GSU2403 family nucleotidyltransferase fold protein [Usitatibacter sp.]